MRSFKIELLRFGKHTGAFQDRYLVAADGAPARAVELDDDVQHEQILIALDDMRYRDHSEPGAEQRRAGSLALLQRVVAKFLGNLPAFDGPTHVEIVTDNVELWSLPFEFARDAQGRDLLGDDSTVVLTRRVRGTFAESANPWPERPRVLFAWYGNVEVDPHRTAFYRALEPWVGPLDIGLIPDTARVLTELRNASLDQIAQACAKAAEERCPYTHVHLLAHGADLPSRVSGLESFGVALRDGTATASALATALRAGELLRPTVVTLAVCDSSKASNTLLSGGRLAYELHAKGVPVVVGSQFPLTEPGAAVFTDRFYARILEETTDVRVALSDARAALRTSGLAGHDWASITAHVRLPEGYADQLRVASLRIDMTQLNTISSWAQRIVEKNEKATPEQVEKIERLLEKRIEVLKLRTAQNAKSTESELESLGILASAHKRLAELVFSYDPAARARSGAILAEACAWYRSAFEGALSHHWTGTQYLALSAVINGTLPERCTVHWLAAMCAAEREVNRPAQNDPAARERVVWAHGSIAELSLLAGKLEVPFGKRPTIEDARSALLSLVELAQQDPELGKAVESTRRQLRRYVYWWTQANGYFAGKGDLCSSASELLPIVKPRERGAAR